MKPALKRPWPVLFLCCALTFNTMGMSFGLGAIFTDIMDTFGVSRATASLVQSVCIGVNFGSGVVTGHFLQKQGPRVTVITGSVLATAGCVIAFFATHIVQVIVGVGVLAGLGSSFIYLTTQILPGILFHDMKSLALPIVSIAVACGTALYPPLYRHVIHQYSLRGTFLIMAAINCQLILCGALIGLFAPRTKTATTAGPKKEADAVDDTVDEGGDHGSTRKSGDGDEEEEDCRCAEEGGRGEESVRFLGDEVRDTNAAVDGKAASFGQRESRNSGEERFCLVAKCHKDHQSNGSTPSVYLDRDGNTETDLEMPQEERIRLTSEIEGRELHPEGAASPGGRHSGENSRPSKKELKSDMNHCCCLRFPCCSFAKIPNTSCVQLDLLQDTQFVVFAVLGPSSYLFFTQPMMFMTDMIKSNQMTVEDGSVFLTVMFAGSLTGRVLAGVLYRLVQSRVPIVYSAAIAIGGVLCLFYSFSEAYSHFVAVSLVFGVFYGLLSSSVPMTFLEILGPRRFAVGMGYMSTVGSVSFLLAGPYGGTIRDLTNSYEPVYYIAIVHGLVVGTVLLFTTLRCRHSP